MFLLPKSTISAETKGMITVLYFTIFSGKSFSDWLMMVDSHLVHTSASLMQKRVSILKLWAFPLTFPLFELAQFGPFSGFGVVLKKSQKNKFSPK